MLRVAYGPGIQTPVQAVPPGHRVVVSQKQKLVTTFGTQHLIFETNIVPDRPKPVGPSSAWLAREASRRALAERREAQDIAAREAAIKERARGLLVGMTVSEVVEVMGEPDTIRAVTVEPGLRLLRSITLDQARESQDHELRFYYKPYDGPGTGMDSFTRGPRYPFDIVVLYFDRHARLERWLP
jgi:hypothetical protein